MSNTKHTPGPWFNEGTKVFTKQLAYCVAETKIEGKSYTKRGSEAEANARLITAAPELLEALEAVDAALCEVLGGQVNDDSPHFKASMKAWAAIQKARGEK